MIRNNSPAVISIPGILPHTESNYKRRQTRMLGFVFLLHVILFVPNPSISSSKLCPWTALPQITPTLVCLHIFLNGITIIVISPGPLICHSCCIRFPLDVFPFCNIPVQFFICCFVFQSFFRDALSSVPSQKLCVGSADGLFEWWLLLCLCVLQSSWWLTDSPLLHSQRLNSFKVITGLSVVSLTSAPLFVQRVSVVGLF